jgi:hypothetical protein
VPYARAHRIEALDAEPLVTDLESLTDDDITSPEAAPQFLNERHAFACSPLAHGVPQPASPGASHPPGPGRSTLDDATSEFSASFVDTCPLDCLTWIA